MTDKHPGRPPNPSRADATLMGDKTYIGTMHSKCGTRERYTKGGGCVHCARVIATEQREALKYLANNPGAQEIVEAEAEAEIALDNPVDDGLDHFADDLM